MVLIEDDQIPIYIMDELILSLDAARFIRSQQILKRAKNDNRPRLVSHMKLHVDADFVVLSILVGNELPALEIHMGDKVFTPCRFHGGLESQHQHTLEAHFLRQLIGGEGFAKAHFGVPEKLGGTTGIIILGRLEEPYRVLNSAVLLWTHTEICAAVLYIGSTIAHGNAGCTNIVYRAAKPFVAILASIKLLETSAFEKCMHIVVGKAAAVRAHGAEGELGAVWQTTGVQLFVDAGFHITVGKAYL